MDQPVNFDNLRSITGGDADMESELFQMFLASSAECIAALHEAQVSGNEDGWRKSAHALKGICFNLGAMPLGEICKKAQDDCRAAPDEKQKILTDMENELARVGEVLKVHM